jgi:hypothetical protein
MLGESLTALRLRRRRRMLTIPRKMSLRRSRLIYGV